MKRIKKIIALALATVMMMAMSITAFAADTTTITVKNLSKEEPTKVSIYKIAEINQDEWKFSDWAEGFYSLGEGATEYTFDYAALEEAAAKQTADATLSSEAGEDLVFENVAAGAYLVLATGDKTDYQPMVAKTYDYNNSIFTANAATVIAKTSTTIVTKETDDTFVSADQLVTFTITTTVPYIADDATTKTFVIYDKPEHLKNLTLTAATIGGEAVEAVLSDNDGVYSVDLTDYLLTENIGKEVVLTITANVDGAQGYKNTAWSNRVTDEDDYSVVTGYTGSITLTKVDVNDESKTLTGAKFSFATSENGDALSFVKISDGVYTVADTTVSTDATVVTEVEVASNGTVKVQGLAEGTYYITETQAPEGYAINSNIAPIEIKPDYVDESAEVPVATGHKDIDGQTGIVKDSRLASLPFTGGMGTTIFTVLGVAIMAIAAALFFATKKNSKATK